MAPASRISPSQPPLNFEHPYLDTGGKPPKKRELGLFDLFVFKMFGCFTPDDLPPPNLNATIYQAGAKSSSSSVTLASTNTANTTVTSTTAPPLPPSPAVSVPCSQPALMHQSSNMNFKSKRRSSRADARSKQSIWPDKMIESPRIVMERTQFVEQRVEERKRQAERQREQHHQGTDEKNTQSSSNDSTSVKSSSGPRSVDKPLSGRSRSQEVSSPTEVIHDFRKVSLKSARTNDTTPSAPPNVAPTSNVDESVVSSSLTGRVSRLSAMFEQQ